MNSRVKNCKAILLAVMGLICFTREIACAASSRDGTFAPAFMALEQRALLGDQSAAKEMWELYSFGEAQYYPNAVAKLRYWTQIAAENGGGSNYLAFSDLLRNYFIPVNKNAVGVNDNFRSFYWVNLARLHPGTVQTQSSANFDLYEIFPIRTNYWRGVASYFSVNQAVVNEAVHLETGGPYFIPLNAETAINKSNLLILEVNALLGDASSASMIACYFQAAKDENELYWRTIAAEDGDVASQLWLAEHLSKSSDSNDRIRAIFWATKVSEQSKDRVLARQAKVLLLTAGDKLSAIVEPP